MEEVFSQGVYTLRLNYHLENEKKKVTYIVSSQKFTFSFLAWSTIDASRVIRGIRTHAMFLIRWKKYVCAQITATFTENGMLRMLKGGVYRVAEWLQCRNFRGRAVSHRKY